MKPHFIELPVLRCIEPDCDAVSADPPEKSTGRGISLNSIHSGTPVMCARRTAAATVRARDLRMGHTAAREFGQ